MIITVDYFKLVGLIIMVIALIICLLVMLIDKVFGSIDLWKRERKRWDDKEGGADCESTSEIKETET